MRLIFTGTIATLIVLLAAVFAFTANTLNKTEDMAKNTIVTERALFAGGCFWCMEKPFESLEGVISVTSGYAGGTTENPTYQNYGHGGHTEVVQIVYDPGKITYGKLLDTFWRQINPTDDGGQFVDRGHEYISAIFVYNSQQRLLAKTSKEKLAASGILKKPVVTPILDAPEFWPAEGYHQDYYKVNPIRYSFYRSRSGRDDYLEKTWSGVKLNLTGAETKVDLKK